MMACLNHSRNLLEITYHLNNKFMWLQSSPRREHHMYLVLSKCLSHSRAVSRFNVLARHQTRPLHHLFSVSVVLEATASTALFTDKDALSGRPIFCHCSFLKWRSLTHKIATNVDAIWGVQHFTRNSFLARGGVQKALMYSCQLTIHEFSKQIDSSQNFQQSNFSKRLETDRNYCTRSRNSSTPAFRRWCGAIQFVQPMVGLGLETRGKAEKRGSDDVITPSQPR